MAQETNSLVYHWHFYLPEESDAPLDSIHARLRDVLGTGRPTRVTEKRRPAPLSDLVVTGFWREWSLSLCCETTPNVALEAQALASGHNFTPPWDEVATSARRIELKSAPDLNGKEFDTYIAIHAELEEAFEDAIAVDAVTSELLE